VQVPAVSKVAKVKVQAQPKLVDPDVPTLSSTTMAPSASPLFSTLATDADYAELVELFVQELPDRSAAVEKCFAAKDMVGLSRVAHQLKGAAGSYGFQPITDVAATLEQSVLNNWPEAEILQNVEELRSICQRARAGTPE
jgi:HPt (histidine-containing phosphotransfer) domain-containing protein